MVNVQRQPHGLGTAVNGGGCRYEGKYGAGAFVTGKMFLPDGALRYEGECKAGRQVGTAWDDVVQPGWGGVDRPVGGDQL